MAITTQIGRFLYVVLMLASSLAGAAVLDECYEPQFQKNFMQTITVLVADAGNKKFNDERRTAAACGFVRILAGLTQSETHTLSDKLIDNVTNLLLDDKVKYYAGEGLRLMGPRAKRAIPALQRAYNRAQPLPGSEVIGPSLPAYEVFQAAINRISAEP